ncbi:hypothetical protein AAG570_010951 [Ranatra chinensis]|uniref:Uncharacterized protein n=1 Tax=Ranatra chinensis TaxID=642074 RepID=A0ABD0Z5H7_9HEMI
MASKRRHTFYQNKKQKTTEVVLSSYDDLNMPNERKPIPILTGNQVVGVESHGSYSPQDDPESVPYEAGCLYDEQHDNPTMPTRLASHPHERYTTPATFHDTD